MLYLIWWSFWAVVQTFVLHRLGLSWRFAAIDSLASNTLLALTSFVAFTIYKYYQPTNKNRWYRLLHGFGLVIFYSIALRALLQFLFANENEYIQFLNQSMVVRFMFSLLMISFITVLNWMWNDMETAAVRQKQQNDAEQLVKDAELVHLRQQLQPHFLFNSLNSISALAGSKPNEARKMIQQLSDFLRGTLKKENQKTITLNEELIHLELYLEIEKVRFGHRLAINMITAPDSLDKQIPPLLIQPIVENAIKFGLYDTTEDVEITIKTYLQTNVLHVEVTNPFDAETQKANEGTGFGLSSIQRRLFLLFARHDLITTQKQQSKFITILKIPQSL